MKGLYSIITLIFAGYLTVFCPLEVYPQKGFETKYVMGGGEALLIEDAEWFMGSYDYLRALPVYVKLDIRYPGVIEYKYYAGMCYLHKYDEQHRAISYFVRAYKEKPELPDIQYYLGVAYFVNYQFDKAIEFFKDAAESNTVSGKLKGTIPRLIENCNNAKILVAHSNEKYVSIENLGAPLNTEYSEYVPLVSYDESVMILTYKGKRSKGGLHDMYGEPDPEGDYYEDIFVSYKMGDKWLDPDDIGYRLNSMWHDAAMALSPDGQRLYVYKDTKGGDLYVSNLSRKTWSEPIRLEGEINTKHWEGHASLSVDGKTLYFASDRPGGLGGKDLYKADHIGGNAWGNIKNLGPKFNTEYDEDAPFIHANGEMLFFSSQGHNSMGGFDIFQSRQINGKWQKAVNLGHPVNTPNDDLYYVVNPSGDKAYFSSTRKGTLGENDIFVVKPGILTERPILALIKGMIKYGDRNAEATINVTDQSTGESYGSYRSNSASGNYVVPLPPGNEYKLEFLYKGKLVHTEFIEVNTLDVYVNVNIDLELSKKNSKINSTNLIQKVLDKTLPQAKLDQEAWAKIEEQRQTDLGLAEETAAVEETAVEETVAVEEPVVEEPAADESSVAEAKEEETEAVEETAAEEPAVEETAVVEEPVVEEPAADESSVAKAKEEETAALEETAAVEETAVEEPAVEETVVVEEPAAEESTADVSDDVSSEAEAKDEASAQSEAKAKEEETIAMEETAAEESAADESSVAEAKEEEAVAVEEPAVDESSDLSPEAEAKGEAEAKEEESVVVEVPPVKETLVEEPEREEPVVKERVAAVVETPPTDASDEVSDGVSDEATPAGEAGSAESEEPVTEEPVVKEAPVEEKPVVAEPVVEERTAESTPPDLDMKLDNVLFGFDMSAIPPGAKKALDELVAELKNNKGLKIEINGHTDHIGPDSYNDKLSLRRANSVANYLNTKGISKARMIINGFGESKPAAPNTHPDGSDNPTGRKKNRRTEIRIVKDQPA